jgi:hypothetical protein
MFRSSGIQYGLKDIETADRSEGGTLLAPLLAWRVQMQCICVFVAVALHTQRISTYLYPMTRRYRGATMSKSIARSHIDVNNEYSLLPCINVAV